MMAPDCATVGIGFRPSSHAGESGSCCDQKQGLLLSHGDYIQWLDADDLLAPDKIEQQMKVMKQCGSKQTLASTAWAKFRYRCQKARFVRTALWCDLSPTEWLLRRVGQNLNMRTATWLVSRELTEAAGPWDTRLLGDDDDNEYFCRILLASDGVRFVPDAKVLSQLRLWQLGLRWPFKRENRSPPAVSASQSSDTQ